MRYPLRIVQHLAATAVLLAVVATPAGASESELAEIAPDDGKQATSTGPGSEDAEGAAYAAWNSCAFRARADDPHRSGSDASGHGAWVRDSVDPDDCPARIKVKVELQAYLCEELFGVILICGWETVGSKTELKYERQQVSVHVPCRTFEEASWRTKVTASIHRKFWFDITRTDVNEDELYCRL